MSTSIGKTISLSKFSRLLFLGFFLVSSLNKVSVYKAYGVPDLILSLSFLIIVRFIPVTYFTKDNPIFGPACLFVFSSLLANLFGQTHELLESLLTLIQFWFIFFIMTPLFIYFFQTHSKKLFSYSQTIMMLFLVSGLCSSFVVILGAYTTLTWLPIYISGMGRFSFWDKAINNFSCFLVMAWPFGLHFVFSHRGREKLLGVISLPILLWGICLSASRYAFIAIPLISCLYLGLLALYTRERGKKLFYSFVIILVLLGFAIGSYIVIQNPDLLRSAIQSASITSAMEKKLLMFYVVLDTRDTSLFIPSRIDSFAKAFNFLADYPIFGVGLSQQEDLIGGRAHLMLLTVWFEGGLLALISILVIYWRILKAGLRILRRECDKYWKTSIIAALIASSTGSFLAGFQTPLPIQNCYHWIPYLTLLMFPVVLKSGNNIE